jgi:hypothetical protein
VLADRLGIDLELAGDGDTRAPLVVEPDGLLGQIGPPDAPTPGLDLLERKMALDLLLAKRARSLTPGATTSCLALLDQAFDGFPEAQVKQIGTKIRVSFRSLPS